MTTYKYKYGSHKNHNTVRMGHHEEKWNSSIYDGENWNEINDPSQKMGKVRAEGNEDCYWEPKS